MEPPIVEACFKWLCIIGNTSIIYFEKIKLKEKYWQQSLIKVIGCKVQHKNIEIKQLILSHRIPEPYYNVMLLQAKMHLTTSAEEHQSEYSDKWIISELWIEIWWVNYFVGQIDNRTFQWMLCLCYFVYWFVMTWITMLIITTKNWDKSCKGTPSCYTGGWCLIPKWGDWFLF